MRIGRLTVSDRAFAGVCKERSGPEIERALREVLGDSAVFEARVIPDETERIAKALRELANRGSCYLVVITGGTGVSPRDVTPEATRPVPKQELPDFAEIMRMQFFAKVRTAILSRAVAGTRGRCLIVNLPGEGPHQSQF